MAYDFGDLATPVTRNQGKYDFGDLASPAGNQAAIPPEVLNEPGLEGVVEPFVREVGKKIGDPLFDAAQYLGADPQFSATLGAAGNIVPDVLESFIMAPSKMMSKIPKELPSDLMKIPGKIVHGVRTMYGSTEKFIKDYAGKSAKEAGEATRGAVVSEAEKQIAGQKELADIAKKHLGAIKGLSSESAKEIEGIAAKSKPELANIFASRPKEEIGAEIQKSVQRAKDVMKAEKDAAIKGMRNSMQQEVMGKELAGNKVQGTPQFNNAMTSLQRMKADAVANDKILKHLNDVEKRLKGAPNFEVLSDEIKALREEAFKVGGSQYAIKIKELSNQLEGSLKSYSSEYGKMIAKYPELNESLEVMESQAGKAASRTGGFSGEARNVTDPSELSKTIFKNPTNFEDFVMASGGNRAAAEKLALDHYKGEISGKPSVLAQKYMEDNASMMRAMPNVKAALERQYIAPMQRFEHQMSQAAKHAKEKESLIKNLASKRGTTQENAEALVTKYENALKPIQDARLPADAMTQTENMVYSLSNDGLITEARRKELVSQLQKTGDAIKDHKNAVDVAKKALQITAMGIGGGISTYWGFGYLHDYFRGRK